MAKFCGKCGSRLNEKTGLCPNCDKASKTAKVMKIGIFFLVFVLLVAVVGALVWHRRSHNFNVAGSLWNETSKQISPADAYLEDYIYPEYGKVQRELSFRYYGDWYRNNEINSISNHVFTAIEEGPVALLDIKKDDYDKNGVEDLLVVELHAISPTTAETENLGNLDGLSNMNFRVEMFLFDQDGEVILNTQNAYVASPKLKEILSIANIDGWIISSEKWDENSEFNSDKGLFFPVSPTRNAESTNDEIRMSNFCSEDMHSSSYEFWRTVSHSFLGIMNDKDYIRYFDCAGEQTTLYSNWPSEQGEGFETEDEACEQIKSALNKVGGMDDYDIVPTTWNDRWENTFLPKNNSKNIVCNIELQATSAEPVDDRRTTGTMTIKVTTPNELHNLMEHTPQTENSIASQDVKNKGSDNSFAFLPRHFDVCGSNHATGSSFNLNPDGTFTCDWIFWDFGDCGDEYPDGTCQISKFRGKFSNLTKVDEFTYKMTLDYSEQWDQIGREYIENNKRYIVYDWDRFDGITEAYVYLPGTKYDFSTEGMVSVGNKELSDLPPYDVDWDELLGNGCVLHIAGMPVFISKSN